jgi:hypothetical protein
MPSGTPQSLEVRFWHHVAKSGPEAIDHHGRKIGKCWIFTGYLNPGGYGMIGLDENNASGKRKSALAHRVSWFLKHGQWPEDHLDHLCRNRACVRPKHLEDVSQQENNRRSPRPKVSHCPAGHELTDQNVYTRIRKNRIARECRQCAIDRATARRADRKDRK